MITRAPAISSLLVLLLVVSPCAGGQAAGGANREWSAVMAVRAGDHVIVESKTGQRFDGTFSSATDAALTVSVRGKTVSIDKADVRRVYTVGGSSMKNGVLIGAAVGAGAGAGLGAAAGGCGTSGFGPCFDRSATIPIGAAAGAVVGALTGLAIGSVRHKRTLIYEMM